MNGEQTRMDFGGKQTAGEVLDRIRRESRDESEKGRWFEQLFMRLALQEPEFEIDAVWRWPDWPEREELTRRDGRHRHRPGRQADLGRVGRHPVQVLFGWSPPAWPNSSR